MFVPRCPTFKHHEVRFPLDDIFKARLNLKFNRVRHDLRKIGLFLANVSSNSFLTALNMSTPETSDSNETLKKELVVQNKMGIHARPAAMIVRIANTYGGEVWVEKDGEQVNGKSIMGLMMLAAGKGSKLVVRTEGAAQDGERMLGELADLFDRRFEEA